MDEGGMLNKLPVRSLKPGSVDSCNCGPTVDRRNLAPPCMPCNYLGGLLRAVRFPASTLNPKCNVWEGGAAMPGIALDLE